MSTVVTQAAAIERAQVAAYRDGFADGIDETLAQLEGRSRIPGTAPYHGPVPAELNAWVAAVRRRLREASADA